MFSLGLPGITNAVEGAGALYDASAKAVSAVSRVGVSALETTRSYVSYLGENVAKPVITYTNNATSSFVGGMRRMHSHSMREFFKEHHPYLSDVEIEEIVTNGNADRVLRLHRLREENPHFSEVQLERLYQEELKWNRGYENIYFRNPLAGYIGLAIPTKEMQKSLIENSIRNVFEKATGYEILPEDHAVINESEWDHVEKNMNDHLFETLIDQINQNVFRQNVSIKKLFKDKQFVQVLKQILMRLVHFLFGKMLPEHKLYSFYNSLIDYALSEDRALFVTDRITQTLESETNRFREIVEMEAKGMSLDAILTEEKEVSLDETLANLKQLIKQNEFTTSQKKILRMLLMQVTSKTVFGSFHEAMKNKLYFRLELPQTNRDLFEKNLSIKLFQNLITGFFQNEAEEVNEEVLDSRFTSLVREVAIPMFSRQLEDVDFDEIDQHLEPNEEADRLEVAQGVNQIVRGWKRILSSKDTFDYVVHAKYPEYIENRPLLRRAVVAIDPLTGQRKELMGLSEILKTTAQATHDALQSVGLKAIQANSYEIVEGFSLLQNPLAPGA